MNLTIKKALQVLRGGESIAVAWTPARFNILAAPMRDSVDIFPEAVRAALVCSAMLALICSGALNTRGQFPEPDGTFTPLNYAYYPLVVQPDQKILVAANADTLLRLNANGLRDSAFNLVPAAPIWTYSIRALAVQKDGKILVGGAFTNLAGMPRYGIARLNGDGTLDSEFNPSFSGITTNSDITRNFQILSIVVQPGEKILIAGSFTAVNGQACTNLVRLNPDGSLDQGFDIGSDSVVTSVLVQPDGKIIVAGYFPTAWPNQPRPNLVRLNTNGMRDAAFASLTGTGAVYAAALQADGKILIGGRFTMLNGRAYSGMGRLNADGTLDSGFNSSVGGVRSVAVQADQKIVVAGRFSFTVNGQSHTNIARLFSDGTLDADFRPTLSGHIDMADGEFWSFNFAILQPDGKVLVSGEEAYPGFSRLNNTEPATQGLTFDNSAVTWRRGGTGPEVWRTTFDHSTNGGTSWINLGEGSRIPGGWRLGGLSLPPGGRIRARGDVVGNGFFDFLGGSWSWFLETIVGAPLALGNQPASRTNDAGTLATFEILANGAEPGYQWRKNGVPLADGANVAGALTRTLTVSDVLKADEGDYTVVVTNSAGSITSAVARLTVMDPAIISQPTNQSRNVSESVTFSANAAGTPSLNYQWWKNGVAVTGATAATLTLTNLRVADEAGYSISVSNSYGNVTSAIARLTINSSPVIALGYNSDGRQATVPGGLSNVVAIAAGWDYSLALTSDGHVIGWGQTTIPSGLSNVVTIAAGESHSLALTADGQVTGWGANWTSQITIPSGLSNVVAIAAGQDHSLALTADGHVVVWGNNYSGQTSVPGGLSNVVAIAAGKYHSLALTADGRVVGWGYNHPGQTSIPSGLSNVVAIAAGGFHSLALTADGRVVGWGNNYSGQTSVPGGLSNVVAIAAGGDYSLALRSDGHVIGWGYYYGETSVPSGLSNVVAIAAGWGHSLAMSGLSGISGPLRIISPRVALATVERQCQERIVTSSAAERYAATGLPPGLTVDPLTGLITGIPSAAGTYSATLYATNMMAVAERNLTFHVNLPLPGLSGDLVLGNQGRGFNYRATVNSEWVSAAGLPAGLQLDARTGVISGVTLLQGDFMVSLTASNRYGSVTGILAIHIAPPVVGWGENSSGQTTVPGGLSNVVAIAAGGWHSLALTAAGRVVGWGNGYSGQTSVPGGLSNVVAIAAGELHSLALTADDKVVGWGKNLVDGRDYNYFAPISVPGGLSNVVAIAAGGNHSLALTADGHVVGWGYNDSGQTNVPRELNNVVAIAAGGKLGTGKSHSLALTADGRVVGWGNNYFGQTSAPSGLSNAVAIAAGATHSLALTADGHVVGWGAIYEVPASIPSNLSNVVAIAAGWNHSLALTTDGRVVGWGDFDSGRTNIPGGLSNVVAIAAGEGHRLALIELRGPGFPALTVQPVSRTIIEGDPFQLPVMALGQGPLTYQWQRNGIDLIGATNRVLRYTDVQPSQAGDYTVIVSNASGATTSRVTRLTVLLRPRLQPLPPKVFAAVGSNVAFTASATGTPPLRYQWRKNGANVPGETNVTFTIPNAQISDGGSYTVVVANDVGVAASEPTLLIVMVPTEPPGDNFAQRVALSGLTNSVSGTNFFATREPGEPHHADKAGGKSVWYTWHAPATGIATFRTRGSAFDTLLGIYTGADFADLDTVASDEDRGGFFTSEARFNAVAGTDYHIAVDGFAGAEGDFVLSWELEITSAALPVITKQPLSELALPDATVLFAVSAQGDGLTHQWYFNDTLIPGATSSTLIRTNIGPDDVGFYSVRVRNSVRREVESLAAALELGSRPFPLSQDKIEDLIEPPLAPVGLARLKGFPSETIAVSLGSIDYQIVNNRQSATQPYEPNPCNVIGGASQAIALRPTSDGTFRIDTSGSAVPAAIAAYRYTNLFYLHTAQVACDDNTGDGTRILFPARANTDYLVVVDSVNYEQRGVIQINWAFGLPPVATTSLPPQHVLHAGDSLTLRAPATNGIPPPHFQWHRNGQPLLGATDAMLVLNNLQVGGYYSVSVFNPIDTVTYGTSVIVEEPTLRVELKTTEKKLRLRFPMTLGPTLLLEGSYDLRNWFPVYQSSPPDATNFLDLSITNATQHFFRARPLP